MKIFLDREALEAPLVEMSAGGVVIMLMVPTNVGDAEPAHQPRQRLLSSRPQHQVPVIGHEAEGQQIDGVALQRLGENLEKGGIVGLLVEQAHAAVAAIQDVINRSRFDGSRATGHTQRITGNADALQLKSVMSPFLQSGFPFFGMRWEHKWFRIHFKANPSENGS